MGVSGLSTRLRALSTTWTLIPQNALDDSEELAKISSPENIVKRLVIDGPSFVYHVHHLCVDLRKRGNLELLDHFPTYHELITAVVILLNTFEQMGLHVDSIFFDGYLPKNKRETRLGRLRWCYTRLTRLGISKHEYLSTTHETSANVIRNTDLGNLTRCSSRQQTTVPHVPFVVPCLIEALRTHPIYGTRIKTVPGEADVFCKLRSDEIESALILSNDSDLFLMKPSCPVGFLDTLSITTGKAPKLEILTYSATEIFQRFGCQDLIKIGYQLSMNSRKSLKECATMVQNSGGRDNNSSSYLEFRETYFPQSNAGLERLPEKSKLKSAIECLDPRVAELVIDFLFPTSSDHKAIMFLIPLVEDSSRSSAWKVSSSLRLVSYGVLSLCQLQKGLQIIEVDRRGVSATEQNIHIGRDFDPNEALKSFSETFSKFQLLLSEAKENLPYATQWYWLALNQVLETLELESSKLPQLQDVQAIFTNIMPRQISWSALHLQAQIQAMLYSYRILKQVIEVYFSFQASKQEIGELSTGDIDSRPPLENAVLAETRSLLGTLPSIMELHQRPGQAFDTGSNSTWMTSILVKRYGLEGEDANDKTWHKSRKHARSSHSSVPQKPNSKEIKSAMTTNPYALLETEDNE